MDEDDLMKDTAEQLEKALEVEKKAQKNFHIREAIQLLELTEED